MPRVKVAVIGAGAAGLCAAKHMSVEPEKFEFDVFEQQEDVGGTWKYTENVGKDEYGLPVHSSMYANLRTNLPKESMAFPGFPFPECNGKSFIHHTDVLKYLRDYAENYDLYKYIKFHTHIVNVQPLDPSVQDPKWAVESCNVITNQRTSNTYDAVMVCNGHYSVPYVPDLPGLNDFEGFLIHSHEYRNNFPFKNSKVVVLGAAASGIDISIEVAAVAKEVVLSHNEVPPRINPPIENLIEEVGIESISNTSVRFRNGREYECHSIIICTGYLYSYPFLHPDCQLKIGNQRVQPFFKHLFHINYPSLGIWALPKNILPFPVYNQQVLVFLKHLKKDIILPSKEEMFADEERDFKQRLVKGMKERHAHSMSGQLQWEYDDQLSVLGGIPPIPENIRNLFKHVHKCRKADVLHYKNIDFKLAGQSYVEIRKDKLND